MSPGAMSEEQIALVEYTSLGAPRSLEKKRPRGGHNRRYHRELYGLLAPYLLGTLVMVAIPAALSLVLAFTHYDTLAPPRWIAGKNFAEIFTDPLLWTSLRNSLFFILLAVPLRVLGALLLALFLNRPRRGTGIYRAAVYLPTIVPEIAYALIWLWIFNPFYGPLNKILGAAGLPTPSWLVDPATAKLAFVIMALFQIGEGFILLLAGLKGIPNEHYEAGQIEGGNRLQLFRFITLPALSPWLILFTFRDVILSFQYTFTPSFVMTGGDPYYSTLFLPLLIFEEAFDRFRFGPGSAMMLLMFWTTMVLLFVLYDIFKGWGSDE